LSQQWIDELARHAPSLKVLVYPGWKGLSLGEKIKKKPEKAASKQDTKGKAKDVDVDVIDVDDASASLFDSWPVYVNDFDVCVTTYDVLRRDLNVARAAPSRPARQTAEYSREERPISPLVMCEWYRVIMDEVCVTSFGTPRQDEMWTNLDLQVQMVGGGKASYVFRPLFHDVTRILTCLVSERWCLSFHAFRRLLFLVHLLKRVFPTYHMFSS
jgi:hypothetical protein